jgi:hypothetical protein
MRHQAKGSEASRRRIRWRSRVTPSRPNRGRSLAQIAAYLHVPPAKLQKQIHVEPPKPRQYRYVWRLRWEEEPTKTLLVVGLIPSTANKTHADPTVWKCIQIANEQKDYDFGELIVVNMFAKWPTPNHSQASQVKHRNLIGPANDQHIRNEAQKVRDKGGTIVAAWGGGGWSRHGKVLSLLCGEGDEVMCFGTAKTDGKTEGGFPVHASLRPVAARNVVLKRYC